MIEYGDWEETPKFWKFFGFQPWRRRVAFYGMTEMIEEWQYADFKPAEVTDASID